MKKQSNMKFLFIIPFMVAVWSISGQMDQANLQDSILYLTAEQEAFMIDKETKSLFKTSPLQYEQKLGEAFSINLTVVPDLFYGRIISMDSDETYLSNIFLQGEAEIRYYYKLPQLIKEKKQANNLSSSYFAFGVKYGETVFNSDRNVFDNDRQTYQIFGAWGDQKRFLNYGYLDYGVEFGFSNSKAASIGTSMNNTYRSFSLRSRTKVGFAFGKKYDIKEETKCPIFKCYLDRKSGLKINYNSLFSISYGKFSSNNSTNKFFARLNPNIAYELKIGNTAFSINQDLDFAISFSNSKGLDQNKFGINSVELDYELGGRYYLNLKSNIKKGKSGNNLSGTYLYLSGNYNQFHSESTFVDFNGNVIITKFNSKFINAGLGVGYQKTVLNDLYFDISYGFNARVNTIEDDSLTAKPRLFKADIKVGKMF